MRDRSSQQSLPPMEVESINRERLTAVESVNRESDWLAMIPRAMGRSGVTYKVLASDLGISVQLLSAQITGVPDKHFSFRRLWKPSREFMKELVIEIIRFYDLTLGLSEQDERDLALGRTIREAVERSLAR